jgi:hypothetical protein
VIRSLAARAIIFGALASFGTGVSVFGLASMGSGGEVPDAFSWPFYAFVFSGQPVGHAIAFMSDLTGLSLPGGDGHAGQGLVALIVGAFLTWLGVFAFGRYLWLRWRSPAPNNSSKPKPLRGSA